MGFSVDKESDFESMEGSNLRGSFCRDTKQALEFLSWTTSVILLEVPCTVRFKSLKTLCVDRVRYADEESFVRLISSSPVLENLIVQSCRDDNVDTFTINVPSLLRNQMEWLGISYLCKTSVSNLRLYGNSFFSSGFAEYPIRSVFFQLVCLEFCGICEDWSKELVHVLQHSPILQILKLDRIQDAGEKVCWIEPSCAPECLLYNLKTFEWTDYDGTKFQKEVAIYILKNARRLVTATVCPFSKASLGKQQIFDELEFATRGSRACELTIAL
ncbi:PREDICTED: putative FBD-associated F-box protein At5g56390 [Camelina sativa]|uniref:FBD-associated F-box protein At5g56390 n=1 Tax=Camelina sativa TaxID=90675 RepID=A0ABM0XR68_CAMSA|nr:PREDICTED: putative FBD-associated F-box protein At5g56390 [Camelina sativa]